MTVVKSILTGFEDNFADHNPTGCKIQLDLDETSEAPVQVDGHISSVLEDSVRHVRVDQGSSVVELSPDTEHHLRFSEHLGEHTSSTLTFEIYTVE